MSGTSLPGGEDAPRQDGRSENAADSRVRCSRIRGPEVLAPAGDWECVRAAVENGADAVYFGVEVFNARMRARNLVLAELPALMAWLHRRGVRGYLTFNTLVFPEELERAEEVLRAVVAAGVDAAIVQDVGICRLIRRLSPDFPIHASTQMTIAGPAGLWYARELGASLAVLARENTLAEIGKIQATQVDDPLPLEVFVHGALCVAYSGQCLTSEALGGRSANRGECAQACRMPYELVSDGRPVDLGGRRYLLSPRDLAGLELVPELVRLGLSSLKIEGRLKQPEYVASIVRLYREAVDRAVAGLPGGVGESDRYEMEMAFSRGLHTGWLSGIDNRTLVHALYPKKRGVRVGTVESVRRDGVLVRAEGAVKPGDGVVFDSGDPERREEGGRVWTVRPEGGSLLLGFGAGSLDFRRLERGQVVWKTSDPELERRVRRSWETEDAFARPVRARVRGRAGVPLSVEFDDGEGNLGTGATESVLAPARNRPLEPAWLEDQLSRLGGTPLRLEGLDFELEGEVTVAVREINQARREAVDALLAHRARGPRWGLSPERAWIPRQTTPAAPGRILLAALARSVPQLEAAARGGADEVAIELEDPKALPEAVARWRGLAPGRTIWAVPPRIGKVAEDWILRQVEAGGADGVLVRGWEHLRFFEGRVRLRGDFSLNVANPLSAAWFLERFDLEGVALSCDLDAQQAVSVARGMDASRLELVVHQHMPMFHMEHCVFCAFLSSGKDFRDCGRPCERHEVRLRDHTGAEHPVRADAGCRNTVFNARAQTGAEYAPEFLAAGLRRFRVDLLDESPDETVRVLERYRALFEGRVDGRRLWSELKAVNQLGVTRGTHKS